MKQKPPAGYLTWDDFYKARAANPELFVDRTSMRSSYPNKFTEFIATNPVTGFLAPGAERFLQRGGQPNILDFGLGALDIATPGVPLAGIIGKRLQKLIGQPTSYDQGVIRRLAEKVIGSGGKVPVSDEVVFSKKVLNKRSDGTLSPLFHDKSSRFDEGVWHGFKVDLTHPTKVTKTGKPRSSANLSYRPGFYGGTKTPQIKMGKVGSQNRVKRDVAFRNWVTIKRPADQGGEWYLAAEMMVIPRKKKGPR